MNHHDADMSDVIVVLEELNDEETQEVVKVLVAYGMTVETVNNETSVVEGCIMTQKVHGLNKLAKVRNIRCVRNYTVDYPVGDPRDLDGPEQACDESED